MQQYKVLKLVLNDPNSYRKKINKYMVCKQKMECPSHCDKLLTFTDEETANNVCKYLNTKVKDGVTSIEVSDEELMTLVRAIKLFHQNGKTKPVSVSLDKNTMRFCYQKVLYVLNDTDYSKEECIEMITRWLKEVVS